MLFKNYALLFFLSVNFLSIILRVNGFRVLPETNSEDGSSVKKTIKTEYGDIIDCFDINKQPAFDHHLLKNHKIQETPNFPNGWSESSSISQVIDLQHFGFHQQCPQGTVPIRRNTLNKMANSPLLPELLKQALSNNDTKTERRKMGATLRMRRKDARYVAARSRIEVWNPKCEADESSSANIWFIDLGNDRHDFSLIVAGWAVDPTLYGDGNTRLSIFWADLISNTGCYDVLCPGFVQVDRIISLGAVLPKVLVQDGPKYHITLHIFQDQVTKNWWLHFGETNTPIGYWPAKIFSHFSNGASRLNFGGYVEGFFGRPEPQMGSGILPDGMSNYKYVSYFSKVEYMGQDNVTRTPLEKDTELYNVGPYGSEFHASDPEKGANFLYGGPNSLKIFSSESDDVVRDM